VTIITRWLSHLVAELFAMAQLFLSTAAALAYGGPPFVRASACREIAQHGRGQLRKLHLGHSAYIGSIPDAEFYRHAVERLLVELDARVPAAGVDVDQGLNNIEFIAHISLL
jgi:hypothetical protein